MNIVAKVIHDGIGGYFCSRCDYEFDDFDLENQVSECPGCGAELDYSDVVKKRGEPKPSVTVEGGIARFDKPFGADLEKCPQCGADCAMNCGSDGDGKVY